MITLRKSSKSTYLALLMLLPTVVSADLINEPLRTFGLGDLRYSGLSPDSKRIVTCGSGGAFLWTAGGQLLPNFMSYSGPVTSAEFSPDETHLITGNDDGIARFWNLDTEELTHTFVGDPSSVRFFNYSWDGTKVIIGSWDNAARTYTASLWHTVSGEKIGVFATTFSVNSVAFSPDGSKIVTAGKGVATLWNSETGDQVHVFDGATPNVEFVAFSPDGTKVLTGGRNHGCRLWDAITSDLIHVIGDPAISVVSIAFSPDGTKILKGNRGGVGSATTLWDATTGESIRSFGSRAGNIVDSVAFSADGTRILTQFLSTLRVYEVETSCSVALSTVGTGGYNRHFLLQD